MTRTSPDSMPPRFAFALLSVCAGLAFINLQNVQSNLRAEQQFVRNQLDSCNLARLNSVYIVSKLIQESTYIDRPLCKEFTANASNVPGVVYANLTERDIPCGQIQVHCIERADAADLIIDDQAVIIDFNIALAIRSHPLADAPVEPRRRVTSSKPIGIPQNGPVDAFDKNPSTFFEAPGIPQSLICSECRSALYGSYSLICNEFQESCERMPREWELLGSDDGESWRILDRRCDPQPWSKHERRDYSIQSPMNCRHFKIIVTVGHEPSCLRVPHLQFNTEDRNAEARVGKSDSQLR